MKTGARGFKALRLPEYCEASAWTRECAFAAWTKEVDCGLNVIGALEERILLTWSGGSLFLSE